MSKNYYIGVMSGTSMDGIDSVLVDFQSGSPKLIETFTEEIPSHLFKGLQRLSQPSSDEINRLGRLDRQVGQAFSKSVNGLLNKANIKPSEIVAIGSHGQTVRHMPNLEIAFTTQIGDPNTIAVETGIDVIADFRRKDVALGGQGAPLVPAFHQQVFHSEQSNRIILNIGGIANVTYLPKGDKPVVGFDTGPGNGLIDAWIQHTKELPYDENGQLAAAGTTDKKFLNHLLSHAYFLQPYPKSTGKELFSQNWLEQQISSYSHLSIEDIQSTLLDLTCHSIANDIHKLNSSGELFVCGGGAKNAELMKRLTALLTSYSVATTSQLGVNPQWVEAIAFAWLAYRFEHNLPANLPEVTGAKREAILGGRFPAN